MSDQEKTAQQIVGFIIGLALLVGGLWLLGVFDTSSTSSDSGRDVTISDCPAIQRIVDSMAGSDEDSIDKAIAVQVLGYGPTTTLPGNLGFYGGNARVAGCDIDIPIRYD